MPYLNIPEDELSNLTSQIIGKARAELETKIQNTINDIAQDLKRRQECPNEATINGMLTRLNGINTILVSIESRFGKLEQVAKRLDQAQTPLKIGVKVLLRLPIPSRYLTAGIQNTWSDTIRTLKEFTKSASNASLAITSGISGITTGPNNTVTQLKSKVVEIENILQQCLQTGTLSTQEEKVREILNNSRGETNTGPFTYEASNGDIYSIEIVTTQESKIAPRRRAIGRSTRGDIIYGEESFSSSVEVLKKEIEFLIEKQLGVSIVTTPETAIDRQSKARAGELATGFLI